MTRNHRADQEPNIPLVGQPGTKRMKGLKITELEARVFTRG